jgi:serine/threonine-protein kinase mTOR
MNVRLVCLIRRPIIPTPTLTAFVEAFIAIGHIAKAVGSDMKPFLDSIMQQVKLGLQNRG